MIADVENLILEKLRRIEASLGTLTETTALMQQDLRMVTAAVNDLAKAQVTSGEIEVMHRDINRLQASLRDLETRVKVLEHP